MTVLESPSIHEGRTERGRQLPRFTLVAATTGAAIGYGLHGPQGAFFGAGIGAALAAGLSIGGDVVVSINQEQISRSDLISGPNREIAYLHGLTEKLPK